jgi:hypothetical protein
MEYQVDRLCVKDVCATYGRLVGDCIQRHREDQILPLNTNGLLPLPCSTEQLIGAVFYTLSPCGLYKHQLQWPSFLEDINSTVYCELQASFEQWEHIGTPAFFMEKKGGVCVVEFDHSIINADESHPLRGVVSKHDLYFFAEVLFCAMQPALPTMLVRQNDDGVMSLLMESDVDALLYC